MILASVWHTGTTYFKEGLLKRYGPMEFSHTQAEGVVERCENNDLVYVTYRDPYHTAASWANRGRPCMEPLGYSVGELLEDPRIRPLGFRFH